MKNRKILEICLSPDAGGLELYMMKLSYYLSKSCDVISVINKSGKLLPYYEKSHYNYVKIKKRRALLSLMTAKEIARIIDENQIEILHLHWTKDLAVCVVAKLLSKQKPKLVQTRHMTMTRFKDDFYHRFIYKNIDLMIAVTQQVKNQIEKFIPQEVQPEVKKVYIGTDRVEQIDKQKRVFLQKNYHLKEKFTVGIFGRIEKGKGQYLVIEAVEVLKARGVDLQLLVVGSPMEKEYFENLQADVEAKKLHQDIIFTGFTTEVQELMQLCDAVVLATKKETFGLVLIEAMMAERVVVASDTGGPLEIIEDGESGLLFQTQNSADLADKLESLLDERYRDILAKSAKRRAETYFESQKQYDMLLDVFEKLLQKSS